MFCNTRKETTRNMRKSTWKQLGIKGTKSLLNYFLILNSQNMHIISIRSVVWPEIIIYVDLSVSLPPSCSCIQLSSAALLEYIGLLLFSVVGLSRAPPWVLVFFYAPLSLCNSVAYLWRRHEKRRAPVDGWNPIWDSSETNTLQNWS
jgi:hypothetical protein